MSSKDKSIAYYSGGNFLFGILLGIRNGLHGHAVGRGKKASRKSLPKKSFWRGPVSARQSTLLTLTVGYFLIITVLLMVNSPSQLLGNFTTAGPSLHSFAQTHQTAIHFFSFYVLAILACFCFRNISVFVAIILMTAYAVVTELAQIPLPNRYSDASDLLANFAGIGGGIVSVWAILRLKNSVYRR